MAFFTVFNIVSLIIFILIPLGGGILISSIGGGGDSEWYRNLHKPSWTPPVWFFPVAWTIIYILLGVASWLVFKRGGFVAQVIPLSVYIVQLILNFAWNPTFFGAHRIDAALGVIIVLWLAIVATIVLFFFVRPLAAYLLIPYIVWVTVATALNIYIYQNNSPGKSDITTPLHGGGPHGGGPGHHSH